jgi:hypothetical protein
LWGVRGGKADSDDEEEGVVEVDAWRARIGRAGGVERRERFDRGLSRAVIMLREVVYGYR